MSLLLRNLRVPLELEGRDPVELAAQRLGLPVEAARVRRKSLDARAGREPVFIYTLELELAPKLEARALKGTRRRQLERVGERAGATGSAPTAGDDAARDLDRAANAGEAPNARRPRRERPIIVGTGPAGLFAAWQLLRDGVRPLLLERGTDATTRARSWSEFLRGGAFDPENNLLFGEGGAGTFSDGKLTTRIKDPRVATVLDVFVAHGAPESTRWLAKPHLGSNALPALVRRMRKALVAAGAEVRFSTRVDEILFAEPGTPAADGGGADAATPGVETRPRVIGVRCGDELIATDTVLLATGHSARDTYAMLFDKGVACTAKPFQIGLRVEHPQTLIDAAQYGDAAGHPALPVAEYALVARRPGGARSDVHSFCMCPGGEILPATEREGWLCVNGASPKARDGQFANSGVVVTVEPTEFGGTPQGGLALQARLEQRAWQLGGGGFGAPGQRVVDFLAGRASATLGATSYPFAVTSAQLAQILPEGADAALRAALLDFDRRLPGYAGEHAMLVGPEARSSAPLRLERDPTSYESPSHAGLYPLGEGAGWAGGIMSAAVDGLRGAEALAARRRPT